MVLVADSGDCGVASTLCGKLAGRGLPLSLPLSRELSLLDK
jgi:hypothetical protein